MGEINWAAYLAVVAAAYLVPGPDFAVVLRAATTSFRTGMIAAAGAQTGLCVHAGLAVVGLSALLARSPGLLTAIQAAGGIYLVVLGARAVHAARARPPWTQEPATDRKGAFLQGLLTNLLNPKVVLFFVSILPPFITAGADTTSQLVALGTVDVIAGFLPWTIVALAGARMARWMKTPRIRQRWDITTGLLLGVIGLVVLTLALLAWS
ncbi:LysE family translocator [Kocuria marina]|uniref:LysE family translocator n=1 Tax=Kocuria marina TaxID=223184 RepID=UPI002989FA96|nr:LysE family translocator [Kocuria marina]MCT1734854.1 LysE family translocator [Kocuria marina]